MFERSLRSFLSTEVAADAVREVESHIRDAVVEAGDVADERLALEGILSRLGPPMRVAQAYSLELVMDEAAATGRLMAVLRSLFHGATTGLWRSSRPSGCSSATPGHRVHHHRDHEAHFSEQRRLLDDAERHPGVERLRFPSDSRRSRVLHELLDCPGGPADGPRPGARHACPRAPLDRMVQESPEMALCTR